jgi:LysM repeat protein
MKTMLRPLLLLVICSLLLAACSPATPTAVIPAATMDLSSSVTLNLEVQYDAAAVYNTVGQILRLKHLVTMTRNDLTDNTPANVAIIGITAPCPPLTTINNLNDRFDTGETLECTGDYILTQADLDRGSVTLAVTANAYTVNSNTVTITVPTVSARVLTLAKTPNTTTYSAAGQDITFNYTITNSGSTQLGPAQFTVTESFINNNAPFNCGNADQILAPSATLTCSASYKITEADMNAASITFNATAAGGGANPSQPASVSITRVAPATGAVGSTVQHTVREGEWLWQIARCYGADPRKVVEANPQVTPTMLKAGMVVTVPTVGTKGTAHSASEPCVKFHTVQSNDTWTSIADQYGADPGLTQMVNANTLIVGKAVKVPLYTRGLGIPLINAPITTTPTTSVLVLTVTPATTTYSEAGQSITFNYAIKNNGTTTLGPTQFIITDASMTPTTLNCGPANNILPPGTSTTCTSSYTVTQLDMSAVNKQFNTTASGAGVPSSAAVLTTLTKGSAQISLSVTPSPATYSQAGQGITFSYVIKNTGTTSLGPAQFTITSSLLNPATFNCGASNTTLAPGAEVTCTALYTVTQPDLDAANVQFNVTASGGGVTSQAVPAVITKQ